VTEGPYTHVLFDVDGTLIDSNGAHAQAWADALREHSVDVTIDQVRPLIGMGGDKLLPAIAGIDADSDRGRAIARRKKEIFATLLPGLRPTRGARPLLEYLRGGGAHLVVATSADDHEVDALLQRAGVADCFRDRATKDDAQESKPDPDIVEAALSRSGASPGQAILVGDTPYDIEAAARAGMPAIALRCGGHWRDDDLRGAVTIADDPHALMEQWRARQRPGAATASR
jgi:HAD superfamily hydrolase (TIGR01509 family)